MKYMRIAIRFTYKQQSKYKTNYHPNKNKSNMLQFAQFPSLFRLLVKSKRKKIKTSKDQKRPHH